MQHHHRVSFKAPLVSPAQIPPETPTIYPHPVVSTINKNEMTTHYILAKNSHQLRRASCGAAVEESPFCHTWSGEVLENTRRGGGVISGSVGGNAHGSD